MTTLIYKGKPTSVNDLVWVAYRPCGCAFASCTANMKPGGLLTQDDARQFMSTLSPRIKPDTPLHLAHRKDRIRLRQKWRCKANHR